MHHVLMYSSNSPSALYSLQTCLERSSLSLVAFCVFYINARRSELMSMVLAEACPTHTATIELTIQSLEDNIQSLEDRFQKKSITVALSGYQKKKEANEEFISPSLYTSTNGYQMTLCMDVNGCGDGEDTHVSVHAQMLDGLSNFYTVEST